MAVYITGDTHGDFTRLGPDTYPELNALTKDDYVIICGDFGGVWDGGKEEQEKLDWLRGRPFTTLFLDGNHENFDLLKTCHAVRWHGGAARLIRGSVLHLTRGQIYELDGRSFFVMGGAASHDISDGILDPDEPHFISHIRKLENQGAFYYRINHLSWWADELPNDREYQTALQNLELANWQVDFVLTHCAPASIQKQLTDGSHKPDRLTDFLEDIYRKLQFSCWFCGHYHCNVGLEQNFVCLYDNLIKLL